MQFYSTGKKSKSVSFKEAVYQGLPQDNGLYFPEKIPPLKNIFSNNLSLQELGIEVMLPFVEEDIEKKYLTEIINKALNFEIPLIKVEEEIFCLELFHGATFAFKDVGARFLAHCFNFFNRQENREITILAATSGDTGGAVASSFYNIEGVKVILLYPSDGVSLLQEQQLTTLGGNIQALKIEGSFDDCQNLVKQAFLDKKIRAKLNISSANSINIARWLPQSIYYFWCISQIREKIKEQIKQKFKEQETKEKIVISVPSGNYGNIASGMLAKKMLQQDNIKFVVASNVNDVVPRYIQSGKYEPKKTIKTYSNAMDVGDPSNFSRIFEIYEKNYKTLIQEVNAESVSDAETIEMIKTCYRDNNYLLDPHTATGYYSLKKQKKLGQFGIFLATAHPCKFLPVMKMAIPNYKLPPFVDDLMKKKKEFYELPADFKAFKDFLI